MLEQIKSIEEDSDGFQTTSANLHIAWSKLCLEHLISSKELLVEYLSKTRHGIYNN
jgi:hypothetical protein